MAPSQADPSQNLRMVWVRRGLSAPLAKYNEKSAEGLTCMGEIYQELLHLGIKSLAICTLKH